MGLEPRRGGGHFSRGQRDCLQTRLEGQSLSGRDLFLEEAEQRGVQEDRAALEGGGRLGWA